MAEIQAWRALIFENCKLAFEYRNTVPGKPSVPLSTIIFNTTLHAKVVNNDSLWFRASFIWRIGDGKPKVFIAGGWTKTPDSAFYQLMEASAWLMEMAYGEGWIRMPRERDVRVVPGNGVMDRGAPVTWEEAGTGEFFEGGKRSVVEEGDGRG